MHTEHKKVTAHVRCASRRTSGRTSAIERLKGAELNTHTHQAKAVFTYYLSIKGSWLMRVHADTVFNYLLHFIY